MVERSTIIPLILLQSQKIVGMCWSSPKTAEKSLEQGRLWVIHPQTKKEIEHELHIEVMTISKHDGWCIAEIDPKHSPEELHDFSMLEELQSTKQNSSAADSNLQGAGSYDGLAMLESVIRDRKEQMPEGSYTTHLFNSGQEKIRKKVGEEAIEVLLSKNSKETIDESADLLYHLFVMLVEEGIEPQKIVKELVSRHLS